MFTSLTDLSINYIGATTQDGFLKKLAKELDRGVDPKSSGQFSQVLAPSKSGNDHSKFDNIDGERVEWVYSTKTNTIKPRNPKNDIDWTSRYTHLVNDASKLIEKFEIFDWIPEDRAYLIMMETTLKTLEKKQSKGANGARDMENYLRLLIITKNAGILAKIVDKYRRRYGARPLQLLADLQRPDMDFPKFLQRWTGAEEDLKSIIKLIKDPPKKKELSDGLAKVNAAFQTLLAKFFAVQFAQQMAKDSRHPLDHKKFLDMLVDDVEEKFIELVEGTRAHTANVDNYIKRIATALEDDFNTQFYYPAFRSIRETSRYWDVSLAQIETTSILTNNRSFARVEPQATMEFDLPKRDILINEAFQSALAAYNDYGALFADPNFMALTKMYSGQPTSSKFGTSGSTPGVQKVLPSNSSQTDESLLSQRSTGQPKLGSQLDALIPDPAIYKFETGTGFEIRPVIQPDGQAVVFHLQYMYTTNVREPVRADEKHLGRVKRHFIDTDVQTGNYELREVSRYQVALKASRTSRGVPFLEDVPGLGLLFRPMPQAESSLQENLILAQTVIYPTLFDLMGLRWAPAVADLSTVGLREREFVARGRMKGLRYEVFDVASGKVDEALRIPKGERRGDLYRIQEPIPTIHPNGYQGPGLNLKEGTLQEGYSPDLKDAAPLLPSSETSSSSFGRTRGRTYGFVPRARTVRQTGLAETSQRTVGRSHGHTNLDRKPAFRSTLLPPPPSRRWSRAIDRSEFSEKQPHANGSGVSQPRKHSTSSISPPKMKRLSLSGAAVSEPLSEKSRQAVIVPAGNKTKTTRRWKWSRLHLPRFRKQTH